MSTTDRFSVLEVFVGGWVSSIMSTYSDVTRQSCYNVAITPMVEHHEDAVSIATQLHRCNWQARRHGQVRQSMPTAHLRVMLVSSPGALGPTSAASSSPASRSPPALSVSSTPSSSSMPRSSSTPHWLRTTCSVLPASCECAKGSGVTGNIHARVNMNNDCD
jgi:hypothetical protein